MAVSGKGKQIESKAPAASLSSKRKKSVPQELLDRRRKRKTGVLQFFDEMAEDVDYEEEDQEAEEEEDNDFDLEDERPDIGGTSTFKDYKGSEKPQYLPFLVKEEDMTVEELEEVIRDRYGRRSEHVAFNEDAKDYDDYEVVEHTDKDPNVWRVKCAIGREQHFAFCLMHKYADLQRRGIKMDIISVFALEHVKGFIYIEADKERNVTEACKGFLGMYPSRMGPVPKNEIPTLFSVRNKPCGVSKGTWVRMKSGNYKGDLGQVVDYDELRRKATIKLVPRIDLQAIAKKFGGGISLKGAAVPAPRLISSHELEHFRPHIEIKRDRHSGEDFEVLDGLMLKDGYLYKKVSIASIVYWGVQPSKDELLKFTETNKTEDDDLSWLSSVFNVHKKTKPSNDTCTEGTSEQRSGFNLHDLVLYGRKDFGVVVDVGEDGLKILKGKPDVQEVITIKSQDIKTNCIDKMFRASDRKKKTIYINDVIKILDGPMEGRVGIVKHMYKGILFIYDESQEENSGIFCVLSGSCENTTSPKDSLRKAGNKSSSSFNQSSFELGESEDGPRSFSRNQQESNQIFSIGQTLRIRKGPLKGYLCHVMGIYRSDVTVKLGSLGKVITVQEQFLSVPNVKRDTSTETSSDFFGAQGAGSTWEALTTNSTFASSSEQRTGGSDPWASKPVTEISDQGGSDPWASKPAVETSKQAADPWASSGAVASAGQGSSGGCDPWAGNSASGNSDRGDADPWCSKQLPGSSEKALAITDPWGSIEKASADNEVQTDNAWGSTAGISTGSDPWGSKPSSGASEKAQTVTDPWGAVEKASADNGVQTENTWGSTADTSADQGGWGSKLVSGQSAEKAQCVTDPWDTVKKASTDKKQEADPWGSKVSVATTDLNQAPDPWVTRASAATEDIGVKTDDKWGSKLLPEHSDKVQEADPWGSKVSVPTPDLNQTSDRWDGNASSATEDRVGDPWSTKIAAAEHKGADPWGSKLAAGSKDVEQGAADPWASKVATGCKDKEQGTDPWSSSVPAETCRDTPEKSSGSWEQPKTGGGSQSGWGSSGWGNEGSSSWSKPAPVEGDGKFDKKDSWDKSSNFEGGREHGGRGRGRFGNRDNFQDGNSSGFGGGWGSGERGRGGRYGNRQNDTDNFSSGGGGRGWGSGERGRRGGRFGNRDRDQDDNSSGFGGQGSWSSGGRGRGNGRFQSSDGGNSNFGGSSWSRTAKNDNFGGDWNTAPAKQSSNDWSASKSGGDGEASFGDWMADNNKSTAADGNWGDKSKSILGEPPSKSWNANEEAGCGNWGSKAKSSGWGSNSDSGNDWGNPKTSWKDNSSNPSNFDDNGGSSFGGRGSFGGGRGPRGGRGRNFNGSGGRGNFGSGDQSDTFTQSLNWNERADKASWNSGGSNSGWSKQDDTNKATGNEGGGGSWGSEPKDSDNGGGSGSGWNVERTSNKENATTGWGDAEPSTKKDDAGWGSGSANLGSKGGW